MTKIADTQEARRRVVEVQPKSPGRGKVNNCAWSDKCDLDYIERVICQMFWVAVGFQQGEDEIPNPPDFIQRVQKFVDFQSRSNSNVKLAEVAHDIENMLTVEVGNNDGPEYPFKLPTSHLQIGDHINVKAPYLLEQATLNIKLMIDKRQPHRVGQVKRFTAFQVELLQAIRINFPNPKNHQIEHCQHWFFTHRLKSVLERESAQLEQLLHPKTHPFAS